MIVYVYVCPEELQRLGRDFKWKVPACPCGSEKVWGHGFIYRYFENFPHPLPLRRYRCPQCGTVFCLRPVEYFRRKLTPPRKIAQVLRHRLLTGRWPKFIPRQRAGHWLRQFMELARVFLWEPLHRLELSLAANSPAFLERNFGIDSS
jgi:hypothetical protein